MIPALIVLFLAVICLVPAVLAIAGMWKAFVKAGQPGWAVLIPIYNMYILLKAAGKPGWWLLLMFIPIVGVVFAIIAIVALAERFGKGGGFAVGMIFLPFIFYPILGFGDAQYFTTRRRRSYDRLTATSDGRRVVAPRAAASP